MLIIAGVVGLMFALSLSITNPIIKLAEIIGIIDRDADLSRRIDIHSKDEIGEMATSFNQMLEKLHNSMREVSASTGQLAAAAEELSAITTAVGSINDMNAHIASAAEEQSAVADEINRNIINISQVADQNTENAMQTSKASEELAHLASQLQNLVARFKV